MYGVFLVWSHILRSLQDRDNQPVHVVFAISVIKSVKVINVRSALVVRNKLEIPLELIALRPDSESEGGTLIAINYRALLDLMII